MGNREEEWDYPSTSEPGPSNAHIVVNPLAGRFEIAEIPPYRPRPVVKKTKPKPQPIDPELARLRLLAEKRRCVAISKAYNLYTDEEIQRLPPEYIPRSVYFGPLEDVETGTNQQIEIVNDVKNEQQPIINSARSNRGRLRQIVHERWERFRNFIQRIRRVMTSFIDMYAPHMEQYYGRTEEECLAIENRSRTVIPEEEKMHVHMLYLRQMEANRKPTPYVEPTKGDRKSKMSQEYIDFVMYKDLQPLIELKKWKAEEQTLRARVEEAKEVMNKLVGLRERVMQEDEEEGGKLKEEDEEEDDEEDEAKASDPLLAEDEKNKQGTSKDA